MSIEPWRKRGFVPDSDDEDEFESLDSNKENVGNLNEDGQDDISLDYIPLPSIPQERGLKDTSEQEPQEYGEDKLKTALNKKDGKNQKKDTGISGTRKNNSIIPDQGTSAVANGETTAETPLFNQTPVPRRSARKYGKTPSTTKRDTNEDIWDIPSSPARMIGSSRKPRSQNTTPKNQTAKSSDTRDIDENDTPQPVIQQKNNNLSRESSPDELMVLVPSPKKTLDSKEENSHVEPPKRAGSDDESSLSSAKSDVSDPSPAHSQARLNHSNEGQETDILAQILPDLEIPDEFQQQSSQQELPQEESPEQPIQEEVELSEPQQEPVQRPMRSLRTHRPEQMNPYTYESLKYMKLMRDAGVRPVKARVEAETPRSRPVETTDESQGQDTFDPNAIRSSPPAEEYLPAPRPERRNEKETSTPRTQHNDRNSLTIRRKQSTKRRKRSRSGTWHDGTHLVSNDKRRDHVSNNSTPLASRLDTSIFDLPSSPPDSGGLHSASQTPHASEGFRYPPGLTPPPTTTMAIDSNNITPEVDTSAIANDAESIASSDEEASSESSGEELETAEEREIRRLQRQTRGVLPASWSRIEAEQRLQKEKASQASRLASQRADAKGVAKKIIRQRDRSSRPSLMDFGDDDESDGDSQNIRPPQPDEENADDEVHRIVGFENPFGEAEEEDIIEDNQVDYMFPSASRKSGSRGTGGALKRSRPKESAHAKERRLKRARLQKQTRITDSSFGARQNKKSYIRSAPRLGILDAPDVANRAHTEQPQFLRVAARRARSRRDGGRQSPTQKFLQLGSRVDTADVNESLRAWKRGAIPQTKLQRPRARPQKSNPAKRQQNSRQSNAASSRTSHLTSHFPTVDAGNDLDDDNRSMHEKLPNRSNPLPVEASATESTTARSTHAERRGHQWMVQRNTAISSLTRNDHRPAIGSLTERSAGQPASKAMFRQTLTLLNRDFRQRNSSRTFKPSLTLDRFISGAGPSGTSTRTPVQRTQDSETEGRTRPQAFASQPALSNRIPGRRLKKHPPNRVNPTLDEYLQDSGNAAPIPNEQDIFASTAPQSTRPSAFNVGGGLFNWHRSYPLDFGVHPLYDGTFFHESTFLGSGEFARSVRILNRDLDRETGFSTVPFKDQTFQWGVWNDKVSSEIGTVFEMIIEYIESLGVPASEAIESQVVSSSITFRSLINYITEKLAFTDPIDRTGFISRSLALCLKLRDPIVASLADDSGNKKDLARITCYNMVFANQIRQIAMHSLVGPSLSEEATDLVKLCAKDAIRSILSQSGKTEIQRLFEENEESQCREIGIRDDFPTAEACVITEQLLHTSEVFNGVFKDLENEAYARSIARNPKDISNLETAWRSLFIHLPFHEIDNRGIVRRELRFSAKHDNWDVVKKLLAPAFESYDIHSKTHTLSYNTYCRTLFQRCHRLINSWGWRDCKSILDTLYDFFAQRTLYNLKLEASSGSPSFLDELDQNPSLEIRPGEPAFHTFLKIIASGLRYLSKRYDNRKIRNFAWRLLPNHGRMYPKEESLLRDDLDALRNHHDLLCTLYWVVPNGYRPRLETIKDLVNPATSHRKPCSINLQCWARLVRFKLSTDEEIPGLEPFADWHTYFVTELRKQHSLARNEAEAQRKDSKTFLQNDIENIVVSNQKNIEDLLSEALDGMLSAIERAPSLEHAHRLIYKTPFESLLSLFNPNVHKKANNVVSKALAVIAAYTRKDGASMAPVGDPSPSMTLPAPEDDSQEYGDWADIDAVVTQNSILSEGIEHVQYALHPVVSRLVSNCFGEDKCPEDPILLSTIDTWTSVAQVLVRHGLKRWDDYLDPFGDESWTRLRETIQTRKFSPQFLAACIEKDTQILSDCRMLVIGMWLSFLMERASLLKFQHRLTEALLNGLPQDPLLQNLPFSKDKKTDRYKLTLEELNQRRISLISSVLCNMREHVLRLEIEGNRDLSVVKREYSESLDQLMTAMKKNYRELGNGTIEAAQGAYVDFVHRIIRFLQELTSDIRPVDPFFTDSALFPLPSSDPRYIVAKLKRYEPKLSSKKELQTLIMFLQSIVERAVLEGQMDHLTEQLHTAVRGTFESGDFEKPTLQAVLLRCIFPGYIELAFSTPSAWLLCRPIIRCVSLIFKDLLFDLDATDSKCVSSVLEIFSAVFYSTFRALRQLFNRPVNLRHTSILTMMTSFIEMISSTLVVVDYLDRLTDHADELVSSIEWFRDFAFAVLSRLNDPTPSSALEVLPLVTDTGLDDPPRSSLPTHLVATRSIAFEEHQSCLKNWSSHGGKFYYIRTGHDSKEVLIEPQLASQLEDEVEAKRIFVDTIEDFEDRISRLELFPEKV
ncbi:hypothetical protein PENSTE_c024G03903 [Penicillium steckii]|uniref:Uncharacterized protein n=1 Tax=Penicillium steckii TaxID=303698 RepID=A0A1V6SRP8_9EURO|nr:hypothetical protein PENSTE_c024G03903 [Penicillium steckii]